MHGNIFLLFVLVRMAGVSGRNLFAATTKNLISARNCFSVLLLRGSVRIIGANPYVLLSADQALELKKGWRGPIPVKFRIMKCPDSIWRVNLMPVRDGTFRLYLNGVIRKATKVGVGDAVTVDVRFDDDYRGGPLHSMPSWFSQGLEEDPAAMSGWEALSPSRQKEILRYFAGLKSDEAKQRNLERALHVLAGGRGRFMGRSWNEGGSTKE
jgi:hypothetical protein